MFSTLLVLCGAVSALAFQAPLAVRSSTVSATETARASEPQMGATIRELRDRVGSVKNTKKITSAMKLVAAAKVRRAQEAVLRSRPFSETLERILGGLLQRLSTEALDIPLLESRTVNKIGALARRDFLRVMLLLPVPLLFFHVTRDPFGRRKDLEHRVRH